MSISTRKKISRTLHNILYREKPETENVNFRKSKFSDGVAITYIDYIERSSQYVYEVFGNEDNNRIQTFNQQLHCMSLVTL